jgi:hypothetical protein
MPSDRTPEQIAADDALTEAIRRVAEAYPETPEGILTGYLIYTVHQNFLSDGNGTTRVDYITKDNEMPWHHIIGLARMGSVMLEQEMAEGWREADEE